MKKTEDKTDREIIFSLISLFGKIFLLILVLSSIVYQLSYRTIIPMNNGKNRVQIIAEVISTLPIDVSEKEIKNISKSVCLASDATIFSETLLIAKIFEESRMDRNAVSSAGYTGLTQSIRYAKFRYNEVDVMNGAKALEDWLKIAKGDLRYALAMYNSGKQLPSTPKVSFEYADRVINLSRKLEKIQGGLTNG